MIRGAGVMIKVVSSPRVRGPWRIWLSSLVVTGSVLLLGLSGCKDKGPKEPASKGKEPAKAKPEHPACAKEVRHQGLPPSVRPEMLQAKFWIDKIGKDTASQRLLTKAQIRAINLATKSEELGVRDLPETLTPDALKKQTTEFHQEQQAFVHAKLQDKSYVESTAGATTRADERIKDLVPKDDYFAIASNTQLRCWPIEGGIFKPPADPDFDRNNCTTLKPSAVVHRIVSDKSGAWHYVQGEFVEGWAHNPRWQPISKKTLLKRRRGSKRWVTLDHTKLKHAPQVELSMGQILSLDKKRKLAWPTPSGWKSFKVGKQPGISSAPLPFTRERLFDLVFRQIDRPYGWGGRDAERDCSRLLLDLFRVFGLQLPRFSGHQAKVANAVDISMLSPKDKRATLRRFGESNVLLLYMPGHVMLYLGPDQDKDYAISSISEFVTPCSKPDGTLGEQVHRLDKVTVTDLSLGLDSPRRSFLERITAMVRF